MRTLLSTAALAAALGAAALPATVMAGTPGQAPVDVHILREGGGSFRHYPYPATVQPGTTRRYVEAEYGARYRIQVRNGSAERVAVVVAVDGRNIISGARSELASNEPMYVLGPYQTQWFEGWRSSRDSVQRFYFTDPGDSYAGAFGDHSAMGVIAVAAFRERRPPADVHWPQARPRSDITPPASRGRPWSGRGEAQSGPAQRPPPAGTLPDAAPAAPGGESATRSAPAAAGDGASRALGGPPAGALQRDQGSQAGTGWGEQQHAPVRYTRFAPQPAPAITHLLRYEWRPVLARLGVIRAAPSANRLWPEPPQPGFAPAPPRW